MAQKLSELLAELSEKAKKLEEKFAASKNETKEKYKGFSAGNSWLAKGRIQDLNATRSIIS